MPARPAGAGFLSGAVGLQFCGKQENRCFPTDTRPGFRRADGQRYVTGKNNHHNFGPERAALVEGGNIVERAIRENVVSNVANLRTAEPVSATI
jgi:hypothetical protein